MPQIQVTTNGPASQPNGVAELESLKSRLQKTWMAGDYDRFSQHMDDGAGQYLHIIVRKKASRSSTPSISTWPPSELNGR